MVLSFFVGLLLFGILCFAVGKTEKKLPLGILVFALGFTLVVGFGIRGALEMNHDNVEDLKPGLYTVLCTTSDSALLLESSYWGHIPRYVLLSDFESPPPSSSTCNFNNVVTLSQRVTVSKKGSKSKKTYKLVVEEVWPSPEESPE